MAEFIGISTELLFRKTEMLIFQDILLTVDGKMGVVEHGHAISHKTNTCYEEWELRWKGPKELIRHWREGHGTDPRRQCKYIFDAEHTEAYYLVYLTALALEDFA